MHPAFASFFSRHHGHGCGPQGCGPNEARGSEEPRDPRSEDRAPHEHPWQRAFGGHPGVRRPLRFLAYKLEMSEAQVTQFAKILDELKVERAQAEVDERRSLIGIADALASETYDKTKVAEATAHRVRTAEKLRDAVAKALEQTHALLQPTQRERLAYLVRTGRITI
ncbi:MAG TPA: Spy/CpxP family protein refolding chaperone [Kofleriaceae bacterium]|nr:Spy/CpxP family protein refolding chaperone [Kofleriaceae bacterium]